MEGRYPAPNNKQFYEFLSEVRETVQRLESTQPELTAFVDGQRKNVSEETSAKLTAASMSTKHPRTDFSEHVCGEACVATPTADQQPLHVSPLALSLVCGWRRLLVQRDDDGLHTCYRAPCGKRLQNMAELECFLERTRWCTLRLDLFCFDPTVSLVSSLSFLADCNVKLFIADISYGQERVPVPCANWRTADKPACFQYCTRRVAGEGVAMVKEPEFMTSCSCLNDCRDAERCECLQLTAEESGIIRSEGHGYTDCRLFSQQISAVYECNQHCQCGDHCRNRVVQRGPLHRVLVFRTETMGWGLMTLDDIPRGAFVCCYTGQVYPGALADQKAAECGDDYQAELDYIEVMEKVKEGYESEVATPSPLSGDLNFNGKELSPLSASCQIPSPVPDNLRLLPTSSPSHSSLRLPSQMSPNSTHPPSPTLLTASSLPYLPSPNYSYAPSVSHSPDSCSSEDGYYLGSAKRPCLRLSSTECSDCSPSPPLLNQRHNPSTRSHFQEKHCYVIDAQECGNIGRFINHSCSPNLFVQNVFVDSHDLRFPWVAFFAQKNIKAGSELFWDYNYIPGSVEGRVLHCSCGSESCRGRLI